MSSQSGFPITTVAAVVVAAATVVVVVVLVVVFVHRSRRRFVNTDMSVVARGGDYILRFFMSIWVFTTFTRFSRSSCAQ